MSLRKKRVWIMAVIGIVCVLVFFVAFTLLWRKNETENRKRFKAFEGVWTSADGEFNMTIRRVTSGHIIFSLESGSKALEQGVAQAVGDEYEFDYSATALWYNNKYNIQPKGDLKGYITLGESAPVVNMTETDGRKGVLTFQGELKKKGDAPDDIMHLGEYMGTEESVPVPLKERCLFERGKDGKVARIYVAWNRKNDKGKYYGCDLMGVNKLCMEGDCEANLGEPESVEEFSDGSRKGVYHRDGYMYVIRFGQNGLVSTVDCRREDAFEGSFQGDFLCQGETLLRYMGDFVTTRDVKLPEGIKKIAGGAFSADRALFYEDVVTESRLSIPDSVAVEPEAFEHCGHWNLTLEEGWTAVPSKAFANMIVPDEIQKMEKQITEAGATKEWVTVHLPKTIRRLEEKAFCVSEKDSLEDYWNRFAMVDVNLAFQPVQIVMQDSIEYIGDNALFGIGIDRIPKNVKYIGTGLSFVNTELELPDGLEELGDEAIYRNDLWNLQDENGIEVSLPASLKKIGESAFGDSAYFFVTEKENEYFTCEGGNLWSKDKSELYYTGSRKENGLVKFRKKEMLVTVPEGTKVMHKNSMDLVNDYVAPCSGSLPVSLKKINRNVLFWLLMGWQGRTIVFKGGVPEFFDELPLREKEINTYFQEALPAEGIRVKASNRDEFIEKFFEGQNLSEKAKKKLAKNIKAY